MASTKKVKKKGMIKVSHGQWSAIAAIKATVEIKNNIQYVPLDLLRNSIIKSFGKNNGSQSMLQKNLS